MGERVDVFDGLRLTRKQNGGLAFCPVQELKKKITKLQDYGRKKSETDQKVFSFIFKGVFFI